ncbi:exo-alpha-sialidase [Trypanosoma cruzi]|nr:exo-alpha-sialidase [Trypanosoma cruzi]
MQKNTAALRKVHALPPVILLLSSPAHPLLCPCTAAHHPAQAKNPTSADEQRRRHFGTCSCWAGSNPCLYHAPPNNTHWMRAANITPATRRKDIPQSPDLPPHEGRRSQTLCMCAA